MEVAVQKVNITPAFPIQLAGFAHRTVKAEKSNHPIYLKMIRIRHLQHDLLLVMADIIWWNDEAVRGYKKFAWERYSLQEHQLVFTATHNHSGPQLADKFNSRLGVADRLYMQQVDNWVKQAISGIMSAILEPCYIEKYEGKQEIGIYRRKQVDGQCLMLPDQMEEIDNQLIVLQFKSRNKQVIATIVSSAIHPTVSDENAVSSEFIGIAIRKIEEQFGQSVAGYLQGFAGDIRPCLIRDQAFYRGKLPDIERFADQLKAEVQAVLQTKPIRVEAEQFASQTYRQQLSFTEPVEVEDAELRQEWLEAVVDRSGQETALVTVWRLSSQLKFLFINAEIVHSYGKALKKLDPALLTVGYADGMVGYIADQRQLAEGGYEVEGFVPYFHVKGRLTAASSNDLSNLLEKTIREIE